MFQTESILVRSHKVSVAMDQSTRRMIGVGVQAVATDGTVLCRTFNPAIPGRGLPERLSTEHNQLFKFRCSQANLRILK